jgi:alanine-glyoxylate transaminase / serine-glyoxylate transaminase / serine-pyruvate transaminase
MWKCRIEGAAEGLRTTPGMKSSRSGGLVRQGREPGALSDYCREECGVVLGRGIGDLQGRALRIAHLGHVNTPMVFGVPGAVEMAASSGEGVGGVAAANALD